MLMTWTSVSRSNSRY